MPESLFTRRRFLQLAASASAVTALPAITRAEDSRSITGSLLVDDTTSLHTIPTDFTGLSYESAQLANPAFFSAANRQLIHLFRELSPCGVLRLGGGSSDYTTYSTTAAHPPFETFGPDTSKTAKKGTVTSELALRHLRAFLDSANWNCLYGLNLGQGTRENAVAEADAAHRILGPRLVAFQIGNEPDTFRHFRPNGYRPRQYVSEWLSFRDAIVARVPDARFAGPDISNKLSYLTAFAEIAPQYRDILLLTLHYYAMGPAGNPGATIDNLLSPDPRLTTLKWRNLPVVEQAMRASHLPCRISEVNSCWNGGEPGVSNVFASALWCADMMLHFASLGFAGVNLHGGGNGIYSPIIGSPSSGFSTRPEYFGIQFAQHFSGATLLRSELQCDSARVTAYAARSLHDGKPTDLLALINKTNAPAALRILGAWSDRHWRASLLSAPSLDAQSGIGMDRAMMRGPQLPLEPHSALLLSSRDH